MKKLVLFFIMMLLLIVPLLSGCGYIYEELAEAYNDGYDEGKFYFYYVKPKQRYGIDDLEEYLHRYQWTEGAYVANKFDCSEMSAYLERKLENEGYHTIIVVGNTPGGNGRHSWLLVETGVGEYMPVEPTTFSIVYWQAASFDNYFTYDYQFETIEDALEYQCDEYNWWQE